MTHDLWANLSRKMVDYLDSVSLQDLVDQQRLRQLEEAAHSDEEVISVQKTATPVASSVFNFGG